MDRELGVPRAPGEICIAREKGRAHAFRQPEEGTILDGDASRLSGAKNSNGDEVFSVKRLNFQEPALHESLHRLLDFVEHRLGGVVFPAEPKEGIEKTSHVEINQDVRIMDDDDHGTT